MHTQTFADNFGHLTTKIGPKTSGFVGVPYNADNLGRFALEIGGQTSKTIGGQCGVGCGNRRYTSKLTVS